jgi:DNA polymerase-3 subunit gamma/tau
MLALARKYRPKRFDEVAVQSHVARTLQGAIARGRVAHGYLLCGPRGVGKTTLARVLAMALNCERRAERDDGEPCGICASCTRIWSGSTSLDVVEIDAASNRGVDDARDLRERAMYAPSGDDRYKVYIVDEAHMLTREAWNTLLKVLEEPPPRVVFIFATTEPQKIAQAAAPVLSRLQRFDLKRIGPAEIRERLKMVLRAEGVDASEDAVAMLARAADGSMRDALSLTDQALSLAAGALSTDSVREALGLVPEEEYLTLLDIIAERRAADVFPAVARLADSGVDFGVLLAGLADVLRAQLSVSLGGTTTELSETGTAVLMANRDRVAPADGVRMLTAIAELEPRFKRSTQQRLLLETLLVRFALLDRAVDLEDLLRTLDGGEAPIRGSAGSAAPTGPTAPIRGAPTSARSERPTSAARRDEPRAIVEDVRPPSGARGAMDDRDARQAFAGPADRAAGHGGEAAAAKAPVALDLNRLVERWDVIIDRLRSLGRGVLASAIGDALPVAISPAGVITIQLDGAHAGEAEVVQQALESALEDLLGVLRRDFSGVSRVVLRRPEGAPSIGATRRLTEDALRNEKIALLRKRDPVLGRAIDVLDLELIE